MAGTGPLNYLVLIGQIELLPRLYFHVAIPSTVARELNHPRTPYPVSSWASDSPAWCEILVPTSMPDAALNLLDAGERDAIQLALDTGCDTLLMDEMKGRREAERRGLRAIGTLSVLEAASQMGLIDFKQSLEALERAGFHLSRKLRDEFLRRHP